MINGNKLAAALQRARKNIEAYMTLDEHANAYGMSCEMIRPAAAEIFHELLNDRDDIWVEADRAAFMRIVEEK